MGLLDSKEKQNTIRLTESRRMKIGSLVKKAAYFLVEPKSLFAWHMRREFLNPLRKFGKGTSEYLVCDDRSAVPISPYECMDCSGLDILTDPNKVALSSYDYASTDNENQQRKSRYYDFVSLAMMGMVIIFGIVILLVLTGKIKMGGG